MNPKGSNIRSRGLNPRCAGDTPGVQSRHPEGMPEPGYR